MERTVRTMAKELAGTFYEQNRTPGFRKAFPTVKHYMKGLWVQADGQIKVYRPGWLHHVELARKVLRGMLQQPDARVSPAMKERVYDALLEDTHQASQPTARKLHQARIT